MEMNHVMVYDQLFYQFFLDKISIMFIVIVYCEVDCLLNVNKKN